MIVLPRSDWTTARPNLAQIALMNGIDKITVHHTAACEMETDSWEPTAGELEHIREFHAGTQPTDRQWADIAYHFVVDVRGGFKAARAAGVSGGACEGA